MHIEDEKPLSSSFFIIASLCDRINAADYLVPEALDMDPTCAPHLMDIMRSLHHDSVKTKAPSTDLRHHRSPRGLSFSVEQVLWGMVNTMLQVRCRGGALRARVPPVLQSSYGSLISSGCCVRLLFIRLDCSLWRGRTLCPLPPLLRVIGGAPPQVQLTGRTRGKEELLNAQAPCCP